MESVLIGMEVKKLTVMGEAKIEESEMREASEEHKSLIALGKRRPALRMRLPEHGERTTRGDAGLQRVSPLLRTTYCLAGLKRERKMLKLRASVEICRRTVRRHLKPERADIP